MITVPPISCPSCQKSRIIVGYTALVCPDGCPTESISAKQADLLRGKYPMQISMSRADQELANKHLGLDARAKKRSPPKRKDKTLPGQKSLFDNQDYA
jgi:hypothetical protein